MTPKDLRHIKPEILKIVMPVLKHPHITYRVTTTHHILITNTQNGKKIGVGGRSYSYRLPKLLKSQIKWLME